MGEKYSYLLWCIKKIKKYKNEIVLIEIYLNIQLILKIWENYLFLKEIVERINLAIKDKNVFITFYDDRKVKMTHILLGVQNLNCKLYFLLWLYDEKYRNYKLNKIKEVYTSEELGKWDNILY